MDDLRATEDGSFQGGGSANVILYVGLGMIAIGLVITFVGLGDKGMKIWNIKKINYFENYRYFLNLYFFLTLLIIIETYIY